MADSAVLSTFKRWVQGLPGSLSSPHHPLSPPQPNPSPTRPPMHHLTWKALGFSGEILEERVFRSFVCVCVCVCMCACACECPSLCVCMCVHKIGRAHVWT